MKHISPTVKKRRLTVFKRYWSPASLMFVANSSQWIWGRFSFNQTNLSMTFWRLSVTFWKDLFWIVLSFLSLSVCSAVSFELTYYLNSIGTQVENSTEVFFFTVLMFMAETEGLTPRVLVCLKPSCPFLFHICHSSFCFVSFCYDLSLFFPVFSPVFFLWFHCSTLILPPWLVWSPF